MSEPVIDITIKWSTGKEICLACVAKIDDMKTADLGLGVETFPFHVNCLEAVGWKINYFTFHYDVDQKIQGVH